MYRVVETYRLPATYRILAIAFAGGIVAACASTNLDAFKPTPAMETVRLESEPAGAEAKISGGQACRTPCALAVPATTGTSVTFTLNGYRPETETLELVAMGDGTSSLRPNPVLVELTPGGVVPRKPAPPPVRKRKKAAPKPKPASAPAPAAPGAASTPAPAAPGPGSSATSPWPTPAR
jgi:hypothetical protein